jgi:pimeloyl-ACP methyl ester carboxylesterase
MIWGLHIGWMSEIRTVVAFDNRDIGQSSSASGDYTPADMARETIGLLDQLEIQRADVCGYSLGGAVAQELALAAPDRVRALVLCSTWATTDNWLRVRFNTWERIAPVADPATVTDLGALDLYTHRFFADLTALEMLRAMAAAAPNERGPDGLVRQWRADQAHDARDRLEQIACPTLVVVGDEDVLVPRRYSKEVADLIPGARLEVIEAAGHGAFLEQPDAFRAAVEPFLKQLDV